MAPSPPEIHVFGAGPTGALTALALGLRGQHVVLFDPLTASELQSRSRAYAITHSSRRLLTNLGLWHDLSDAWLPGLRMWVGEYPFLLRPAFEELCQLRLRSR